MKLHKTPATYIITEVSVLLKERSHLKGTVNWKNSEFFVDSEVLLQSINLVFYNKKPLFFRKMGKLGIPRVRNGKFYFSNAMGPNSSVF